GPDDRLKRELIGYNMDDCRAAATIADALGCIRDKGTSDFGAVDVRSLEVSFQPTYGKLDCALADFEKINNAAYWDYHIRGPKCRCELTRRSGGASGSRDEGVKAQGLIAAAMPKGIEKDLWAGLTLTIAQCRSTPERLARASASPAAWRSRPVP